MLIAQAVLTSLLVSQGRKCFVFTSKDLRNRLAAEVKRLSSPSRSAMQRMASCLAVQPSPSYTRPASQPLTLHDDDVYTTAASTDTLGAVCLSQGYLAKTGSEKHKIKKTSGSRPLT